MAQTIPPSTSPGNPAWPGHRHGLDARKKQKFFLLDLYSTAVGKKYVMAITGHHRHRLRRRPHGRQPEDVPGQGVRRRLRASTTTASSCASCSCPILPAHRDAVGHAAGAHRRGRPAPARRVLADGPEPQGAAGEVPERPRLPDRQLRQPHDALDRHHRAAVHRLAPARPHRRHGQPRLRARRRRTATSTPASAGCRSRSSTSSPTSRSGVHLYHGTWSLFQSIGWANPRFTAWRRYLATGLATVVVVGNVSFPVAVLAGIVEI